MKGKTEPSGSILPLHFAAALWSSLLHTAATTATSVGHPPRRKYARSLCYPLCPSCCLRLLGSSLSTFLVIISWTPWPPSWPCLIPACVCCWTSWGLRWLQCFAPLQVVLCRCLLYNVWRLTSQPYA